MKHMTLTSKTHNTTKITKELSVDDQNRIYYNPYALSMLFRGDDKAKSYRIHNHKSVHQPMSLSHIKGVDAKFSCVVCCKLCLKNGHVHDSDNFVSEQKEVEENETANENETIRARKRRKKSAAVVELKENKPIT